MTMTNIVIFLPGAKGGHPTKYYWECRSDSGEVWDCGTENSAYEAFDVASTQIPEEGETDDGRED